MILWLYLYLSYLILNVFFIIAHNFILKFDPFTPFIKKKFEKYQETTEIFHFKREKKVITIFDSIFHRLPPNLFEYPKRE